MAKPVGTRPVPVDSGQPDRLCDVRAIQSLLNRSMPPGRHGSLLKVDGLFGPRTLAALTRFQRDQAHFHRPDGVVDLDKRTVHALTRAPGVASGRPAGPVATSSAPPVRAVPPRAGPPACRRSRPTPR